MCVALMKVVHWPNEVLETVARPVDVFDDRLKQLAEDMHETMDHAGGIGLAANQIGCLKRIITIHIPWSGEPKKAWHKNPQKRGKKFWHGRRYTFVNPKINSFHGRISYMEGCLSFPGMMDYVDRHRTISVEYQDVLGEPCVIECDGLMSICLQHEIDHIDGIVFTKRMHEGAATSIRQKMMAKTSSS